MKYLIVLCALGVACLLPAWSAEQEEPAESSAAEDQPAAPSAGQTAEGWIGKTAEELVAAWGEPSRTKPLKGGEQLLVYKIILSGGAVVTTGGRVPISSPDPARLPTEAYAEPDNSGTFKDGRFWMGTPGSTQAPVHGKAKAKFRIDAQGKIVEVTVPPVKSKKEQDPL